MRKKGYFLRDAILLCTLFILNVIVWNRPTVDPVINEEKRYVARIPYYQQGIQVINFGFDVLDYLSKFGKKQSIIKF